ncbi:MAG: hypothetical protein SXG53_16455 [Pseudomonadota bacterium]|nr:hypothetical protein [Pseudomonadota bacterium]
MIRRQHVVSDFFEQADEMREALDARFKDAYSDRISWYYFCDPGMYAYLRAAPQKIFEKAVFDRFMQRLRFWCLDNLGLVPVHLPSLHLMVNGCKLGLHSDFHNGVWGYVYSLTRWDNRKFSGGETLLMRDGVPSYKKHHVHGEVLYELIPACFNQLLVFDDRMVHATPAIEGSMDPLEGRLAMVGHIRATAPIVVGSLNESEARRIILEYLPELRERLKAYKEVQGTLTYKLSVSLAGKVMSVTPLTDNVVTPVEGYAGSAAVDAVKEIVRNGMSSLAFPEATTESRVTLAVLIPIPDLRPIEFSVSHGSSSSDVLELAKSRLGELDELEFHGEWDGDTCGMSEPLPGKIQIDSDRVVCSFDPPMWVPSQRESFRVSMLKWVQGISRATGGRP